MNSKIKVISSRQNPLFKARCKLQQKKFREKSGLFLVEGIRMVEEALNSDCLVEIFVAETFFHSPTGRVMEQQIEENNSLPCFLLKKELFVLLAETESPQGIIGVVRQQHYLWTNLPMKNGLILILDNLQDPGNLGTIWRTAWAAGVDAVFCLPGTVDPYNSKTIRASMGAVFHLPIIVNVPWVTLHEWYRTKGFQFVAADLRARREFFSLNFIPKTALVIGNEGRGFLTVPLEDVNEKVKIPLKGGAESLNAAVASGILLYEVLRQRKMS